ncbi:MAG: DUF805 domain-containing protein [Saprospiraceae bacterium]
MFKHPFSFEGRIRRLEFGLSILIYYAALMLLGLLLGVSGTGLIGRPPLLVIAVYIPTVWFLLAQGSKRCHDRNNSGWFQLIPFYGLWMLFAEGDRGENTYGPDPKGRDDRYTDSNILDTPETF